MFELRTVRSRLGVQLLDHELGGSYAAASDVSGPMFAILGDPEEATLDWLVRRRTQGEAAYAFLVGARPGVLERLRDAGWTCVTAGSFDDPADSWRAASTQTGYVRGRY